MRIFIFGFLLCSSLLAAPSSPASRPTTRAVNTRPATETDAQTIYSLRFPPNCPQIIASLVAADRRVHPPAPEVMSVPVEMGVEMPAPGWDHPQAIAAYQRVFLEPCLDHCPSLVIFDCDPSRPCDPAKPFLSLAQQGMPMPQLIESQMQTQNNLDGLEISKLKAGLQKEINHHGNNFLPVSAQMTFDVMDDVRRARLAGAGPDDVLAPVLGFLQETMHTYLRSSVHTKHVAKLQAEIVALLVELESLDALDMNSEGMKIVRNRLNIASFRGVTNPLPEDAYDNLYAIVARYGSRPQWRMGQLAKTSWHRLLDFSTSVWFHEIFKKPSDQFATLKLADRLHFVLGECRAAEQDQSMERAEYGLHYEPFRSFVERLAHSLAPYGRPESRLPTILAWMTHISLSDYPELKRDALIQIEQQVRATGQRYVEFVDPFLSRTVHLEVDPDNLSSQFSTRAAEAFLLLYICQESSMNREYVRSIRWATEREIEIQKERRTARGRAHRAATSAELARKASDILGGTIDKGFGKLSPDVMRKLMGLLIDNTGDGATAADTDDPRSKSANYVLPWNFPEYLDAEFALDDEHLQAAREFASRRTGWPIGHAVAFGASLAEGSPSEIQGEPIESANADANDTPQQVEEVESGSTTESISAPDRPTEHTGEPRVEKIVPVPRRADINGVASRSQAEVDTYLTLILESLNRGAREIAEQQDWANLWQTVSTRATAASQGGDEEARKAARDPLTELDENRNERLVLYEYLTKIQTAMRKVIKANHQDWHQNTCDFIAAGILRNALRGHLYLSGLLADEVLAILNTLAADLMMWDWADGMGQRESVVPRAVHDLNTSVEQLDEQTRGSWFRTGMIVTVTAVGLAVAGTSTVYWKDAILHSGPGQAVRRVLGYPDTPATETPKDSKTKEEAANDEGKAKNEKSEDKDSNDSEEQVEQ